MFSYFCSSADLAGANILLLARGKAGLENARKEMLAARQAATQIIDYKCVDLAKPAAVRMTLDPDDFNLS
jgi:hypothetical protein